jgi:hypothetical protein
MRRQFPAQHPTDRYKKTELLHKIWYRSSQVRRRIHVIYNTMPQESFYERQTVYYTHP